MLFIPDLQEPFSLFFPLLFPYPFFFRWVEKCGHVLKKEGQK